MRVTVVTSTPPRPADRALGTAREVATRLAERERLERAIATAPDAQADSTPWDPATLAQGHPGLALLFAQLEAGIPGEGWDEMAHRHLRLALDGLRAQPRRSGGLFAGLAGIAFAAQSIDEDRHARLLATLDGLLARYTEQAIARMESRERGAAERDFDLVSGLAGIGAYLLTRRDEADTAAVVGALVRLLLAEGDLPGWHTPAELLTPENEEAAGGRINCGLAHGLPGPLAFLSLAALEGVEADRLEEAIRRGSGWLVEQRLEDECGVNWPYSIPLAPDREPRPARAGWCYGAPGICRALWLAGEATADDRLQRLAIDGLQAVSRRPPDARAVDAPTFCHGISGLLQITLRMANDSGSASLAVFRDKLLAELLDRFEPDSILGYRDLDPEGHAFESPGLLEGAAGVALVLLAAAADVPPRWDRMFLLA
jgi:hypothetical protein